MDFVNWFFNSGFNESATKIHWTSEIDRDALPEPKRSLEWYEVTEVRNRVNSIFRILGGLSAVASIFTAVVLTGSLTASLITASLALTGIALLVAAIYLSTREVCELDPVYRMEKRLSLLLKTETPPFFELNAAISGDILSRLEVQGILRHEINNTDYHSFVKKHEIQGLHFLDVENRTLLKPKYLEYLRTFITDLEVYLEHIQESEEVKIFDLTPEDLMSTFKKDENNSSLIQTLGSHTFSAMENVKETSGKLIVGAADMALRVTETVVPKPLMNAIQCTAASIQLASKGEYKKSAKAALGAVTFASVFTTGKLLEAQNPEAYQMAEQINEYQNLNSDIG